MPEKYEYSVQEIVGGRVLEYTISRDGAQMDFSEVLDEMACSEMFRAFYNRILNDCPYTAFRWENPSITKRSDRQDYSFVLVNNPGLERKLDKSSFAEFLHPKDEVAVFPSLGRDSTMIIPTEPSACDGYGHLASFVRTAPKKVIDRFWHKVSQEVQTRICDEPIWLSTAGGGVSWLHVRIDSRPKYYHHSPYKA